ncbi:MAG: Bug family tripartite tricarboxylate transporter substrate binding protein [Burkholderiales bacterium]
MLWRNMQWLIRIVGVASALFLIIATEPRAASAQSYPTKPIRIIVPFVAGGVTEAIIRAVQPRITKELGQGLVIDNRGGANSNIGAELVARAAPDGYTLLMGTVNLAVNVTLYPDLTYDLVKDFEPITVYVDAPYIVTVTSTIPVKSLNELIAYAKANPRKLSYASNGSGSPPHLAAEMFKSIAKIEMTHVPYKGSGQSVIDLLGGQVQVMFGSVGATGSHLKSGKLIGLAVTGSERSGMFPEMPTLVELGYPSFGDVMTWYGLFAPRGTSNAIIERIYVESARALNEPLTKSYFSARGFRVVANTPAEFRIMLRNDIDKYAKVLKASGAKLD